MWLAYTSTPIFGVLSVAKRIYDADKNQIPFMRLFLHLHTNTKSKKQILIFALALTYI